MDVLHRKTFIIFVLCYLQISAAVKVDILCYIGLLPFVVENDVPVQDKTFIS
jgi:hypothetical protein